MIFGIMGAMPDEVDQLCAKLENVTVEPYGGVEYHKGTLAGKQVVVCCAGMGKANAAATTQVLITKFGAEKIIFSGIAGNMTSKIGIGDVVIGKTVLYHDAQLDMICQNPPFLKEYTGDPELIAAAEAACAEAGVKALVPDTTSYVRTDYADIAPRIGDAELVLINKCRIDEAVLAQCPNLKWVGIIATGTDNIDLDACRRHGVAVANVPGYSTYSVAQMTFSLLLAICQCAQRYDRAVKDGYWQLGIPAEYGLLPQVELLGKTFGIYGYGSIGRQTARIAKAFGMEVLVCTRTVRPAYAADEIGRASCRERV